MILQKYYEYVQRCHQVDQYQSPVYIKLNIQFTSTSVIPAQTSNLSIMDYPGPDSACFSYHPKTLKVKGSQYNELLKQVIMTIHTSSEDELQQAIKKQMKKIDEFDIQDIDYMEIISHWILSKLYYLEQKLKEIKGINMSKIGKHKLAFIEKIKQGLRNYDKIKLMYESALQLTTAQSQTEEKSIANSTQKKQVKMSQKPQKKKEKVVQPKPRRKKKQISSSSSSSSISSSSSSSQQTFRRQKRGRKPGKKIRQVSRNRRQ